MASKKAKQPKEVATLRHGEEKRRNIPTAEYQSMLQKDAQSPVRVAYERRNRDLDPQLVWRGKDEQDWSDLVVHAPPLYIQESSWTICIPGVDARAETESRCRASDHAARAASCASGAPPYGKHSR